jgi:RNA polymerase-binding transcription factor DksA
MKANPRSIPRKWSWHHGVLTRLRESLVRESNERNAASRMPTERGGTDFMEMASGESEHDALLAQISQEQTELAEVDAALARIRDGTYGICEITGVPIAAERLRAIPWTRWSRTAAARHEVSGRQR